MPFSSRSLLVPLRAKREPCQTTNGPRGSLTAQSLGLSQRTSSLEQSSELHHLNEFSEHTMVKTTKKLLPSFSSFCWHELKNIRKPASFLPLVLDVGTWKLETERRGGRGVREGSLQISAISQPDYLLTECGHCSSFPLDGGTWGCGDLWMGIWIQQKKHLKKRRQLRVLIRNLEWCLSNRAHHKFGYGCLGVHSQRNLSWNYKLGLQK